MSTSDIVHFERGQWTHTHLDGHGEIFLVTVPDGERCPYCPPPDPNPPTMTVVAVDRDIGVIAYRSGK